MDETSIRLYQNPSHNGYLVDAARRRKLEPAGLTQNVSKGVLRGCFSHAALISDDVTVQPLLPQIIFINQKMISATDFEECKTSSPSNVILHRVENPWMTVDKMKIVLKELAHAVNKLTPRRRIILIVDTYKSHISRSTWLSANAHGIWMLTVPPKATWALQPCDTHLFATFKDRLAGHSQRLAISDGQGNLPTPLLLKALNAAVADTLTHTDWRKAFADLGLRGNQMTLSQRSWKKLGWSSPPTSPGAGLPSLEQLQQCFPRHTEIPIGLLFSSVVRAQSGEAMADKDLHELAATPVSSSSSSATAPASTRAPLLLTRPLKPWPLRARPPTSPPPLPPPPLTTPPVPRALLPRLRRLPSQQQLPPPRPPPDRSG